MEGAVHNGQAVLGQPEQSVLTLIAARRETMVRRATDAMLSELPAYAASPNPALAEEIAGQIANHIDAFLAYASAGRPPEPDDLSFIAETVDRRTDQGIPAEQILLAHRVGHRVLWEIIVDTSESVPGAEHVASSLALPMMRYIEAAWSVLAKSYIYAERRLAADLDRLQSRVVDAMIDGRVSSDGGLIASGNFPIGPEETYLVLVVHGFPDRASAALRIAARRIGESHGMRASAAHVREEDLICVVALAQADTIAASGLMLRDMRAAASKLGCAPALGVGMPSLGPEHVPDAYREAAAAAASAAAGESVALLELRLVERLTVMLQGGAHALRLIPPPLHEFVTDDVRKGGQLVATLLAYAACDLNARLAAAELFVHRNTVLYRLQRIGELTGLDPRSVADLLDLLTAVRLLKAETGAEALAAAGA